MPVDAAAESGYLAPHRDTMHAPMVNCQLHPPAPRRRDTGELPNGETEFPMTERRIIRVSIGNDGLAFDARASQLQYR